MFCRTARVCVPLTLFAASVLLVSAASADSLYFAHMYPDGSGGSIEKIDLDGGTVKPVFDTGYGVRGIALEPVAGKLYWTDTSILMIRRSNLDGTGVEDIITSGLEFPRSIAADAGSGKIYFGDQLTYLLKRADLDGSDQQTLRSTAFHAGLAIDTVHGKIYWSTSDLDVKGKILRSNLNGSGLETVISSNDAEFKPAGVAVDPVGGRVYWTDYVLDVVRRANLDGSDMQDLFWVGANYNPRAICLDLPHGKLYWGQDVGYNWFDGGKIMRMDLDGALPEDFVTGLGLVTEVAVLPGGGAPCHPADANCDNAVDLSDIEPFVDLLIGTGQPCSSCAADVNADGSMNGLDIAPFVDCLLLGGCN